MKFPLDTYDIAQLPTGSHPGAFGAIRKHHIHEGIDLYAEQTALVYAISAGVIIAIYQFTGEAVGMPWWEDTWAIAVQDDTGIWVYGEIQRPVTHNVGDFVEEGKYIAQLKQVLKTDKGRPMTMLHLERWKKYSSPHTMLWQLDQPQPDFLIDPTPLMTQMQEIRNMNVVYSKLDEPLEFDEDEVIEREGADAWDQDLLDTDNPYPKGDKYDGSPWAKWDDGWWRASDAWMLQEYPDRFQGNRNE